MCRLIGRQTSRRSGMKLRFVLLCAVLLTSLARVHGKSSSRKKAGKVDTTWKSRERACMKNDCSHIHKDEQDNCVYRCTSPGCYDEVYKEPLEPGEINLVARRTFIACVRKEERTGQIERNKQRKLENEGERQAEVDRVLKAEAESLSSGNP